MRAGSAERLSLVPLLTFMLFLIRAYFDLIPANYTRQVNVSSQKLTQYTRITITRQGELE